jgi:hypothetical protein
LVTSCGLLSSVCSVRSMIARTLPSGTTRVAYAGTPLSWIFT